MSDNLTVLSEEKISNVGDIPSQPGVAAAVRYKMRRNTTTGWVNSSGIIPSQGEPCAEMLSDGRVAFKIGDGINQWVNLPYAIGAVDDGELT